MEYYVCKTCGNINTELLGTWDSKVARKSGLCEHAINQPDKKSFNHHPQEHVIINFTDISVYSNLVIWGTYGKTGDSDLKFVLLKDCSIDHLKKIRINLETGYQSSDNSTWFEVIEYLIENKREEIINLMGGETKLS